MPPVMRRDPLRPAPAVLDMTPEGDFRGPAPAAPRSWLDRALLRVGGLAAVVAVVAGGLALASLAVLVLGLLLPVAIVAGAVAAGGLWWRMRRARARMATAGAFRPGYAAAPSDRRP